jgi:DNA polymerase-3 subunit beta
MNFSISRDALLKPLQFVAGVVERRNTLVILGNVLLEAEGSVLRITGTDMEVELIAEVHLENPVPEPVKLTVAGRKLLDIVKSLPAETQLQLANETDRLILKAGRSRFSLSTLPANEFPNIQTDLQSSELLLAQGALKKVIQATSFAMAVQDVRYYLNGILLELKGQQLRAVATDGHRLALSSVSSSVALPSVQVIVPRKGILELDRLLEDSDQPVRLALSSNHLRAKLGDYTFTTKLIDGKFPDYERVIPRGGDKEIIADKEPLKQVLTRVAILSNEKYRGVRVGFESGNMQVLANNPEQEEAEENLAVDYTGESLEIGFNVSYLIDVLSTVSGQQVLIKASDNNSSVLLRDFDDDSSLYVVMPMRL